jgi:hypothetical protein
LRQKRAIFRQFFAFLMAHSGATQLKKGGKMAEKSLFLAKRPNPKHALKHVNTKTPKHDISTLDFAQ